ncbi:MAG: LolA family protein [Planctomycetota bacterium]|jgi:hypothetical protein
MKKYLESYTILTIILFFLSCSSLSTVSSKKREISIGDVNYQIDKIKAYHVKLNTRIYPPDVSESSPTDSKDFDTTKYVKVVSNVFGITGKKMSIETKTIPPDMDLETVSRLINDGTWLWVEIKVIKFPKLSISEPKISAIKIHVPDVSPDPKNEPFNTIYGQTGTGIFQYTDLPGTLKELIEEYRFNDRVNSKSSQEIILSGTKQIDHQYAEKDTPDKEIRDYIDRSTQFCKLWVSKKTGLIKAYLIGKSEKRPIMHTEIEYISINAKLPDDIFVYKPPKGVEVRDATAAVLKKAKKR